MRLRLKDSASLHIRMMNSRDRKRIGCDMRRRQRLSELDSKRRRNTALKRRNVRGLNRKKSRRGKKKPRLSKRGSELRLRQKD